MKKDLKLQFLKDSLEYYHSREMYWPNFQENGNPIIKTTCGQSLMYLPFTCWVFMFYSGTHTTGYEIPFSVAICVSTLVYFFLSLLLLRKILKHFSFRPANIALAILLVSMGTNMLNYTTYEMGNAHINGFFLVCCLMWLIIRWREKPAFSHGVGIGIVMGLLILIRPTNILFGLLIPLYGVKNLQTLRSGIRFLWSNKLHLFTMAVVGLLVYFPQLLYWKYASGHWFYYSYSDEQFFFNNPHLLKYLMGFRKGWFIYSPLILLALIGLFMKHRSRNMFLLPTVMLVLVFVYLNCCWWTWWFGGGFGARAMIETYPLLTIGFCLFFESLRLSKILSLTGRVLLVFFFLHNIKSAYFFRVNKIHYDSMTWEAYKYTFFRIVISDEECEYLKTLYQHPEPEKAKKGLET